MTATTIPTPIPATVHRAVCPRCDWDLPPGGSRLVVLHAAAGTVSGSHKEPAATAVAAAAAADGHRMVTVGSCGNYALAMAAATRNSGMSAVVVVPAGFSQISTRARRWGAKVIEVEGTYEDAVAASRTLAQRRTIADGNVDGPYSAHVHNALAALIDGLAARLDVPPAVMWVPMGNGTTITAYGAALRKHRWPTRLVGVTSRGNNSIATSWPRLRHQTIAATGLHATSVNEPLVNWDALHGQAALDAIRASAGGVMELTDTDLRRSADLGWELGGASPSGAAGVAGYARGDHGLAGITGVHVAVLTDRAAIGQHDTAEDNLG